jgi:hypothetical protein
MGRVALCGCILREAEGFAQKDPMQWNGYAIPKENLEMQRVFIHDYLPSDIDEDEDDFHSDIAEERHSRSYARRLAGPEALPFWEGANAWNILTMALALGKSIPISGALVLTFEWPAADRPSPAPRRPTHDVLWSPLLCLESPPQVLDGAVFDKDESRREGSSAGSKAKSWWKRIFF